MARLISFTLIHIALSQNPLTPSNNPSLFLFKRQSMQLAHAPLPERLETNVYMAESKLGKLTFALRGSPEGTDQAAAAQNSDEDSTKNVGLQQAAVGGGSGSGTGASSSAADPGVNQGLQALSCLLARGESELDEEIQSLKDKRDTMKKEKKKLNANLRNTERKRSRLRKRAQLLSTSDLLEVYAMRVRKKATEDTKCHVKKARVETKAAGGVSKQ